MISTNDVFETLQMIRQEHLDVRTITMGISLLDCASSDSKKSCDRIYDKICRKAVHFILLVQVLICKAVRKESGVLFPCSSSI